MHSRQRGVTLPELLVTLVVAGVLLAITVPSFGSMFARLRVQGASAEFGTDLHSARTEAMRQRSTVTVTSNAAGDGYTITAGASTLKAVSLPTGVSITAATAVTYDAMRALATPAAQTFLFQSSGVGNTAQLRVSTNVMGRVQLCVPSGSIPGYPAC